MFKLSEMLYQYVFFKSLNRIFINLFFNEFSYDFIYMRSNL